MNKFFHVSSGTVLHLDELATTTEKIRKTFNRCKNKNGGCSQICNPEGKQKCACLKGFVLLKDGKHCEGMSLHSFMSKNSFIQTS